MGTVAVVGGGYAGVRAARMLGKLLGRDWSIVLVDRNPCHQLITRLPHVVSGVIAPDRACIPFRRIVDPRVQVLQAEVYAIDPERLRIETSAGMLTPDWLILALGTVPDFMGIPGVAEHMLVLKSLQAAVKLRRTLEAWLSSERLIRVAVVGAGYTGTELAGELGEWSKQLRRAGGRAGLSIQVLADADRLLPEGNQRLASIAESVLRGNGVSFALGTPVQRIEAGRIVLQNAREVEADVLVWAARTRVAAPLDGDGWLRGRDQRILVDPYLKAVGYDRIYVAGDSALAHDYMRNLPAPATAQLATVQGDLAARNLAAELHGRWLQEVRATSLGEALSLGGPDGAAEVAGVVLSGRAAVATKEAALLRYLVSLGGIRLAAEYR